MGTNAITSDPGFTRTRPARICDVVMKGGITSGVVYPSAICRLSQKFSFRNVGGTSAGAIAAAATAAAECGRKTNDKAFQELERLPDWLAASSEENNKSNLFSLFQPQPGTRPLFELLCAAIGSKKRRLYRILWAVLKNFPFAVIIGVLPGCILGLLALATATSFIEVWSLLCAFLLVIGGAGLAAVTATWLVAVRAVPGNSFGLCVGHGDQDARRPQQLTDWLTDFLDRLAGKTEKEGPLTFGDLWGTDNEHAERDVNLQLMTTNLTHGRALTIPFEQNIFYFKQEELRSFFPERVVRWMMEHPRANDSSTKYFPLCPLPDPAHLPVVVGVRLSLSFPALLSAVPLYAVHYEGDSGSERVVSPTPERCWFSDGGICSNFPVHYFDQALPRWPTFAINLRPIDDAFINGVWMPQTNNQGLGEWWNQFDKGSGLQKLAGFVGAVLGTMENWLDNAQTKMPGFRDRVVQIGLRSDEGGMNLNMSTPVIKEVARKGTEAANMLIERFATDNTTQPLSWDNHRWVRYRSTMALVENLLERFAQAYENPMRNDRSYAELIVRGKGELPKSYPWNPPEQRNLRLDQTKNLVALAEQWKAIDKSFVQGAPRPRPILRIMPRT